MRKTILLLINGFGIEKNDSTEVYSPKLMPNFDDMMKNYLFTNLFSNAGDYNNAYRIFSMPEVSKGVEDEIDNLIFDKKLGDNQILQNVRSSIVEENKLHVFYIIENANKLNQFREFITLLNPNKDKHVYVHLILTATSTSAYDNIIKVISKISFEMSDYCKVGMVVGRNKIDNDDVRRVFYREQGEHWNESTKKFEILKKEIVNPEDAGVFIINRGFALKENDTVLFMNYEDVKMDVFYNDFTKIPLNLFSIFPFKDNIPFMFTKTKDAGNSFASIVEKFGIKILHMTTQDRINDVNYFLNGMEKKKSPNITYAINDKSLFRTKEGVIKVVDGNPYDGFILDFYIGGMNRMEAIKKELAEIDAIIKTISEVSKEKDYTFIVSSLYGIHVPVTDGVIQKVINFSGKVPCIFQSNIFGKAEYSLNSANTYALAQTFLTNINDEVKANKLVHKLNSLEKMLNKGK